MVLEETFALISLSNCYFRKMLCNLTACLWRKFVGVVNFDIVVDEKCEYCNIAAAFWKTNGILVALMCIATLSAVSVLPSDGKKLYWLHSLVLVILKAFAGGCLGPILIGKLPVIIENDAVVLCCTLAWYFVHNTSLVKILTKPVIRCIWTAFAMLFRTNAICSMTKVASNVIVTPRPIYSIPLVSAVCQHAVCQHIHIYIYYIHIHHKLVFLYSLDQLLLVQLWQD